MNIESGIPIPIKEKKGSTGRPLKYPWPQMNVGDSIKFEDEYSAKIATMSARAWGKKRGERDFSYRKADDGYRVWRIK